MYKSKKMQVNWPMTMAVGLGVLIAIGLSPLMGPVSGYVSDWMKGGA